MDRKNVDFYFILTISDNYNVGIHSKSVYTYRRSQAKFATHHCVCAVDKIAAKISHEEFMQAQTFETNKNLAGERGGVFRDPPQSKVLRDKLKAVNDEAVAACFPNGGKVSSPKTK